MSRTVKERVAAFEALTCMSGNTRTTAGVFPGCVGVMLQVTRVLIHPPNLCGAAHRDTRTTSHHRMKYTEQHVVYLSLYIYADYTSRL